MHDGIYLGSSVSIDGDAYDIVDEVTYLGRLLTIMITMVHPNTCLLLKIVIFSQNCIPTYSAIDLSPIPSG